MLAHIQTVLIPSSLLLQSTAGTAVPRAISALPLGGKQRKDIFSRKVCTPSYGPNGLFMCPPARANPGGDCCAGSLAAQVARLRRTVRNQRRHETCLMSKKPSQTQVAPCSVARRSSLKYGQHSSSPEFMLSSFVLLKITNSHNPLGGSTVLQYMELQFYPCY